MRHLIQSLAVVACLIALGSVAAAQNGTISPTSGNAGNVSIGSSDTLSFTISNTGFNTYTVNSFSESGAGCADFSVSPTGTNIPTGGSVDFTVTFTPSARGARSCTFTASDNDTTVDTFAASGTGISPNLGTSPSSLAYGTVAVSGGTSQLTVTITNNSPANATLNWSAAVTAGATTDYSVTPGSGSLAVGGSTMVTVTFNPTAAGARNATMVVSGNDGLNPSDSISLTGTGGSPQIATSTNPLAFGGVHVGNNANLTETVSNPGNMDLVVSQMTITGTNANQFSFTDHGCTGQTCNTAFTVSPAPDSENVVIRCTPTSTGAKTATLTFVGNQDAGSGTVSLTCTGTAPDVNVTDTSLAYGDVLVGDTSQLTFMVQNTSSGATAETLDFTMAKSGAGQAAYSVSPPCTSTCTVAAGGSQTVTVTFAPTAQQAYPATITLTSDDPDEASVAITLSGTGVAPVIGNPDPASQSIAFGGVALGSTSTAVTATVQNTGDAPLNVSAVALIGANANQFSIVTGTTGAHVVAVGATDSWGVVCSPTSIGAKNATLRISSDALNDTTFTFALTCTGEGAVFMSSGPVDFGGVPVGMSDTLSATITNNGNIDGTITAITSGDPAFTFVVVGGDPPRVVAPGGSITVDVTFMAADGSLVSSNLAVTTDGTPSAFNIPLTGDGVIQGADVMPSPDGDDDVDIDPVCVGIAHDELFRVTNTGENPFIMQLPTVTGAGFTVVPVTPAAYPATIPAGGVATFNVHVDATVAGNLTGALSVVTDLPSNQVIQLQSVGLAAGLGVTPAGGVDFGSVAPGSSSSPQAVILTNCDGTALSISEVSLTGSAASEFAIVTGPQPPPAVPVAVAESVEWTVEFRPSDGGAAAAALHVVHDNVATGGGVVDVDLIGVGEVSDPDAGPGDPDGGVGPDGGGDPGIDDPRSYYSCSTGSATSTAGIVLLVLALWAAQAGWRRRRRRAP
jgi:hypothetical protein